MDGTQPRLRLAQETSKISRQHPDNEEYGFLFESLGDYPVEVSLVHFLPAPPAQLGSNFGDQRPAEAITGLHSPPQHVSAARYFEIGIDRDDPLGEYRIEVYVDGNLADVVRFEVVP